MTDLKTLVRDLRLDAGDLLAEHAAVSTEDLKALHAYRDNPHAFIYDHWPDFKLYPRQVEIVEAVHDSNRIVIFGCNAAGKDAVVARLILWFIYARDGLVVITLPTVRQVKQTIINQEIRPAFQTSRRALPGQVFDVQLKRADNPQSGIVAFTGGELSSMSGYHAANLMIVISEAQGVADHTWEAAAACATGAENKIIAIGNPIHRGGKFESATQRWRSVQFSAFDHPNIVHDDPTIIPGGCSRAWIKEIAEEWGEDSDWYRVHVLGEFPQDDADTNLVTPAMLDRAVARYRGPSVRPPGRYTFSLDPSEGRADESVVCVRKGDGVIEMVAWKRAGATETRDKLIEVLRGYQCGPQAAQAEYWSGDIRPPSDFDLVVDSIAFGAGVADVLEEAGLRVTRFKASHRPVHDVHGQFFDSRAQSYWAIRKALEANTLALPPDPMLLEELLAIRWGLTSKEQIQIEKKKHIRTRIGRSTDRADALAMSFSVVQTCSGLATMADF